MKTRNNLSIQATFIALLLLLSAGCAPALAGEVSVGDTPPAVESVDSAPGGFSMPSSIAARDVAMLYSVPTAPTDTGLGASPAATSPIAIRGGTGRDTRLGVDVSSINATAEREGWPWYAKAGVVVGVAALVGLAAWAIVEASHDGSHDQDSSTHITVVGDDGSTVNVRVGSDNNSSSTSTGW